MCTRHEAMNGSARCRKLGGLGWLRDTQGHAMSPLDRAHMTFYSTLIETMRLSCIVFEILLTICRKSPILTCPPTFGAPAGGGITRWNFNEMFGIRKLQFLCCRVHGFICVILYVYPF